MRATLLTVLVAGVLLFAPSLSAQAPAEAAPGSRLVSIDPAALIFFGWVSVEFEQSMGSSSTWGLAVTHFDWRDRNYSSFDVKGRYYLEGERLEGVAIGSSIGLTRPGSEEREDEDSLDPTLALGVGFNVEYQWLLGEERRLALTTEAGGKRLFFLQDRQGASRLLPQLRVSIGWVF